PLRAGQREARRSGTREAQADAGGVIIRERQSPSWLAAVLLRLWTWGPGGRGLRRTAKAAPAGLVSRHPWRSTPPQPPPTRPPDSLRWPPTTEVNKRAKAKSRRRPKAAFCFSISVPFLTTAFALLLLCHPPPRTVERRGRVGWWGRRAPWVGRMRPTGW